MSGLKNCTYKDNVSFIYFCIKLMVIDFNENGLFSMLFVE